MRPDREDISLQNTSRTSGWLVVIAATAINLALGALYAWSMFKGPLMKAPFQLSSAQSSVPYSVACLTFALMMVPAGRLQDRIGPRWVATIGGVLVGAGFMVASLVGSYPSLAFPLLIVGFGVLAGAGIGLGYASTSPPAIKWFPPERKGLIVGIVVGGFGLASVYVAPLTESLIKDHSVAFAFKALGALFFLVIVVFAQLVNNPPAGYVAATPKTANGSSSASAASSSAPVNIAPGAMLRTWQFWCVWLMFFAGAGAGLMVISFIKTYATEIPSISIAGFVFVALLAIGNASGRVVAGLMSDRLGRTRTMLVVFLLQAGTLLAFSSVSSTLAFAVGSIVIGFCYGSCLSVFPSIMADYYGLKNLGMNYGLVFTSWGIGALVMAPLAGMIKDATHSYSMAFYAAAGLLVAASVLTFLVRPPARA
jgi:MFS transporter, OFA family, oxalate/formate antiporter